MRKITTVAFILLIILQVTGAQIHSVPKLFVGIVVDQMREDFLFRFYDQYGDDGFKRLMNGGFVCRNVNYNYVPTITAVGHASIYSGTTPKYHGIIGNSWYNRQTKQVEYCVEDPSEKIVGNDTPGTTMGISTRHLISTNLADELKICTNQKAKVISISLKDRAAALSAGHMPDGVFWFDLITGNFVSSTFFMDKLPDWVVKFNHQKNAFKYLDQTWNLLLPEDRYTYSIADDNNYEEIMRGKTRPTFPYNLKEMAPLDTPYFEVLNRSPFGNSILCDLAIDAIQNTELAKDDCTDLLEISFSSTDAVGHTYGPLSKETNDTYLRLDRELARLFNALDQYVGKGNYTLFLTADHGLGEVPKYLIDHKIPAGDLKIGELTARAAAFLNKELGVGLWIETCRNEQFYLNRALIDEKKLKLEDVQNLLANFIRDQEGVFQVFTATQLNEYEFTQGVANKVQNGFYYQRCGDVKFILNPGWCADLTTSATHSAPFSYDTHVPLLFYGAGVPKGVSFINHNITDIAPTVSMMLHIKVPSACTGVPISEMLNKKP